MGKIQFLQVIFLLFSSLLQYILVGDNEVGLAEGTEDVSEL